MKCKTGVVLAALMLAAIPLAAKSGGSSVSGDYLEVRSCDVYTGPCFANGEMGLTGKEGMMVWSIRQGSWNGASLDGLNVIAVVHTDGTLGDLRYQPRSGKATLIVDAKADALQKEALQDLARTMAGDLIRDVTAVTSSQMEIQMAGAAGSGNAKVKAGDLVEISTRGFNENDHLCGNERVFYPPLTPVEQAAPAFTELAAFQGNGLDLTWESRGQRSAFLGTFKR